MASSTLLSGSGFCFIICSKIKSLPSVNPLIQSDPTVFSCKIRYMDCCVRMDNLHMDLLPFWSFSPATDNNNSLFLIHIPFSLDPTNSNTHMTLAYPLHIWYFLSFHSCALLLCLYLQFPASASGVDKSICNINCKRIWRNTWLRHIVFAIKCFESYLSPTPLISWEHSSPHLVGTHRTLTSPWNSPSRPRIMYVTRRKYHYPCLSFLAIRPHHRSVSYLCWSLTVKQVLAPESSLLHPNGYKLECCLFSFQCSQGFLPLYFLGGDG